MSTILARSPLAAPGALAKPSRQQYAAAAFKPARLPLRLNRHICKSGADPNPGESQPAAPEAPAAPRAEKLVDPQIAKGQTTAIVTGAISIIFGVVYLALVSFLDLRGGEMLPPPPEAFGP